MDISDYILTLEQRAKAAAAALNISSHEARVRLLLDLAARTRAAEGDILAANAADLANAAENGVRAQMLDRLRLSRDRIFAMADAVEATAALPDPLCGDKTWTRPSGITITEERVPLGLVAVIYEARPNVTLDVAALCIKSGNGAILRCGKEAIESAKAICRVIGEALAAAGFDPACVSLIERTERQGADALMQIRGYVDVLIPRGGKGLISRVVENAKVPVIETGAGNCHIYVEKSADLDTALAVIVNAKTQRPSVCNAAESLLCDRAIAKTFLPRLEETLTPLGVEIRADQNCIDCFHGAVLATEEDHFTEYNDLILSVKVVENVKEAVEHINIHGTKHSEAILTTDSAAADLFCKAVDAACVYVNTSTRFTDGGEFGYGAEIGISTQKLHARGPMGLRALTTVRYKITSDGAVRKSTDKESK